MAFQALSIKWIFNYLAMERKQKMSDMIWDRQIQIPELSGIADRSAGHSKAS